MLVLCGCYKFDRSATTLGRYIWVLAEAYLTEVSHLVILFTYCNVDRFEAGVISRISLWMLVLS